MRPLVKHLPWSGGRTLASYFRNALQGKIRQRPGYSDAAIRAIDALVLRYSADLARAIHLPWRGLVWSAPTCWRFRLFAVTYTLGRAGSWSGASGQYRGNDTLHAHLVHRFCTVFFIANHARKRLCEDFWAVHWTISS